MSSFFLAVTNFDWFSFLKQEQAVEANFWVPNAIPFRALQPGAHLLFKIKAPHNAIGGGGIFLGYRSFGIAQAWQFLEKGNGAPSLDVLRRNIFGTYWNTKSTLQSTIGSILLEDTVFFERKNWIQIPASWKKNISRGRKYTHDESPEITRLWERYAALRHTYSSPSVSTLPLAFADPEATNGNAFLNKSRQGRGLFRVQVMEAYQGRCAITGENTPLVLQAAHIVPIYRGGQHSICNGMLLRSDFHTMFELGYLSVRPDDYTILVSSALHDFYVDGVPYNARENQKIYLPQEQEHWPSPEYLEWHNQHIYQH